MTDFPQIGDPGRIIIGPHSLQALGVEYAALATGAPASTAWGTINLVRAYPFVLPEPLRVLKLWLYKGATVTGNCDVGLYTEDGTRLVSAGTTAVAATGSILQEFDVTDTTLGRGRFYCAALMSLTTTTAFANTLAVSQGKLLGWLDGGSGNAALPATITWAVASSAVQPLFGLAGRTLVA